MNLERPFVPAFLKKFDDSLLKNHPEIWSIRAHLVIYYCLLFDVLLALACYLIPSDTLANTNAFIWTGFLSVISIIGIVIWLIYLLRFNVFKRFGLIHPFRTLLTYFLYFISTAFIFSFSYVPAWIETVKANRDFDKEQVVRDINQMNLDICRLEYHDLPNTWEADTTIIVDTLPENLRYSRDNNDDDIMIDSASAVLDTFVAVIHKYYKEIDTATLRTKLLTADSSVKINDTLYVFLKCPDFNFVGPYYRDEYTTTKTLTSNEIYHKVIAHFVPPDRKKVKDSLQKLIDKYYSKNNEPRYTYHYDESNFRERLEKSYKLETINEGLQNYNIKAFRWKGLSAEILFRIIFYASLIFSLLLFVFRHSTVRTFFLTLLCLVIFTILSSIFIAIFGDSEIAIYAWYIFYFVLFTIVSVFVYTSKRRNLFTGIAVNACTILMPFVPLTIIAWIDELNRMSYYSSSAETGNYTEYHKAGLIDTETISLLYTIAEIAGPVILLVAIYFLIHSLYRRWYALPQE